MAQKPMLRAEVHAHAMRASQNRKKEETAYESYMNPEPGFQSGPGDTVDAD